LQAKPMLFVNMEDFQWETNVNKMKNFVNQSNEKLKAEGMEPTSSVVTVRRAAHQNPSDFSTMAPSYFLRRAGMLGEIDPILCLNLITDLCIEFLKRLISLSLPLR